MFVREILSKQGYLTIRSVIFLFSFYFHGRITPKFFVFFKFKWNIEQKEEAVIDTYNLEMTRRRKEREMRSCLLHISYSSTTPKITSMLKTHY